MKTVQSIIVLILIATCLMSCVQDTHEKTIHFKVDMSNVPNANNVGVKGQFPGESWEDIYKLTDSDNDGIYEGSITYSTGQGWVSFKFVNELEVFELNCQNNRSISFKYEPETIVYEALFDDQEGKQTTIKN